MSNSIKQSLEKTLEALGKDQYNFGYPVIVGFDQVTTNYVLKQEFIERYSSGLFLDPMNSEIDVEPGVSQHELVDFCLDEPRLSFENADLSDSKAMLLMRTVRGKQLQLSRPLGAQRMRMTRMAEATPINGPALVFDIKLNALETGISDDGRIYFSFFAKEGNYNFYGGVTEFERDKLGLHFKKHFESYTAPPDKNRRIEYTLGQMTQLPNPSLNPHRFKIRTHKTDETSGDGAVVLFIELEEFDSSKAVPPDENSKLPYLLPDGYSASMLVNTDFLGQAIIASHLNKYDTERLRLAFKVTPGYTFRYHGEGQVLFDAIFHSSPAGTIIGIDPRWTSPASFDEKNSLFLEIKGTSVTLNFTGKTTIDFEMNSNGVTRHATADYSWSLRQKYKFEFDNSNGASKIVLVQDGKYEWSYTPTLSEELKGLIFVYNFSEDAFLADFHRPIGIMITTMAGFMNSMNMEIDTFIMSSLLFRNSHITLDSLHQPNDFFAPGQLAADRNKFKIIRTDGQPIDKGETYTLPGRSIPFKTEPATEGVTWSVRHVPDYEGDNSPGKIDPPTGDYRAPAADEFKGTHVKVIVTATKGAEVSHALVCVLRTSVNVYPSVASVNVGAYTDIIAGEMNGNSISWKVEGLGDLGDVPEDDPLAQTSQRYLAPTEVEEWDESMPVVDMVMRHSKVVISSGDIEKVVDILIPVEMEGSYWLEPKEHDGGVKHELWVKPKNSSPIQVPQHETSWHVRVGNGTIKDGVYTPDPDKPEEYAVIVAIHDTAYLPEYASIIVPLPFLDVKQYLALYAPDNAKAMAGQ